jgi:chloramphenicol 3-O-phosphotransferase
MPSLVAIPAGALSCHRIGVPTGGEAGKRAEARHGERAGGWCHE